MGSYRILYGMEKIFAIFICALVLCGCSVGDSRPDSRRKVAVQTYSLHKYTLEEALEILAPMGIDGVECYPEQVLSKSMPEVRITPKMTKEQRNYLKSLFKKHNLKMASYGVCFGHNESGIREICEFAKDFGCGSVITEDREDLFPLKNTRTNTVLQFQYTTTKKTVETGTMMPTICAKSSMDTSI